MRINDLNRTVNFERKTLVSDSSGGFTATWNTAISNAYVAIWPVSAKEMIKSGQTMMAITHQVRTRYRSDITHDMRIKFGTKYFNIVSIINNNTACVWLDIMAKEIL